MKFFLDTEFIENGPYYPLHLISIGLVSEDGREFYAENLHAPLHSANEWVKRNVIPKLRGPKHTLAEIRAGLLAFVGNPQSTESKPEFWGYYSDYDWVVFAQIFGTMVELPQGWPMFCLDLKQWAWQLGNPRLPTQKEGEHNARTDARWHREVYDFLTAYEQRRIAP